MKDKWNRTINYMRISVTDQCNLRCCYCMPEGGIPYLNEAELLNFEEILEIVKAGVKLGIDQIKITGGEPLLRKNITQLITQIKKIQGIKQVTLTSNGVLLNKYALLLRQANVDSININLPALSKEKYESITRRNEFEQVMEGIRIARELGIRIKINCVSRKTITDEELLSYADMIKNDDMDVRFIEMMPLGHGRDYETYSNDCIAKRLGTLLKRKLRDTDYRGNGPALYYQIEGYKGKIGFISAVNHKFCNECNRIRLSAQGELKLCLNFEKGVSLKHVLRYGESKDLVNIIEQAIYDKPQEHCFYGKSELATEHKNMVQIGG